MYKKIFTLLLLLITSTGFSQLADGTYKFSTIIVSGGVITAIDSSAEIDPNISYEIRTLTSADLSKWNDAYDRTTAWGNPSGQYAALGTQYYYPTWLAGINAYIINWQSDSVHYVAGNGAYKVMPTSLSPNGSAGGDLTGSYPNPTLSTTTATAGVYGTVTINNKGLATSGKRSELYSGTTNGSGVYTVTFSAAYSVAPNIQANLTNQSSTNQYLRISSVSTTGFTVNVYAFSTNTLLGIVSLISTTTNVSGSTLDVLVTEK